VVSYLSQVLTITSDLQGNVDEKGYQIISQGSLVSSVRIETDMITKAPFHRHFTVRSITLIFLFSSNF